MAHHLLRILRQTHSNSSSWLTARKRPMLNGLGVPPDVEKNCTVDAFPQCFRRLSTLASNASRWGHCGVTLFIPPPPPSPQMRVGRAFLLDFLPPSLAPSASRRGASSASRAPTPTSPQTRACGVSVTPPPLPLAAASPPPSLSCRRCRLSLHSTSPPPPLPRRRHHPSPPSVLHRRPRPSLSTPHRPRPSLSMLCRRPCPPLCHVTAATPASPRSVTTPCRPRSPSSMPPARVR
ncbi:hypothetical protein DFH94DRAFT_84542 [Russula ochroleuca]|jgi:hypothetical protein|uniref:Uncharacterized protein n=1 Tax=Russula ochroleuca TaxID=152965 RepID=A0A9P5T7S1_9AGAM|nr:hypothetical protein DFH94DRAFT_84542 [Russula ochroleuca]